MGPGHIQVKSVRKILKSVRKILNSVLFSANSCILGGICINIWGMGGSLAKDRGNLSQLRSPLLGVKIYNILSTNVQNVTNK